MILKYVMFAYTTGEVQRLYPVIFPEQMVHALIAEAQRAYRHGSKTNWVRATPVSAGFVTQEIGSSKWACYGESESLKMKAHPEDAHIMNSFSYLFGVGFEKREED